MNSQVSSLTLHGCDGTQLLIDDLQTDEEIQIHIPHYKQQVCMGVGHCGALWGTVDSL